MQAAFAAEPKVEEEPKAEPKKEKEAVETWYTVEAGDSLGYISRKYYGDNSGVNKIIQANELENADMIFAGQSLLIP